jgi:hypothetical protein
VLNWYASSSSSDEIGLPSELPNFSRITLARYCRVRTFHMASTIRQSAIGNRAAGGSGNTRNREAPEPVSEHSARIRRRCGICGRRGAKRNDGPDGSRRTSFEQTHFVYCCDLSLGGEDRTGIGQHVPWSQVPVDKSWRMDETYIKVRVYPLGSYVPLWASSPLPF